MLFFFPRGGLDEILNLIESVSEGFPSYFSMPKVKVAIRSEVKIVSQKYLKNYYSKFDETPQKDRT